MTTEGQERDLWLNEEEALGLLDIVMLCPGELSPAERVAVLKLSDFVRQFLRAKVKSAGDASSESETPAVAA